MDSASIALVLVAGVGIIVPLSTTWLTFIQNRNNSRVRKEAADRASVPATQAAVKADHAAIKVEQTRKELVASNTKTDVKLATIHDLVNSQLTEAVNRFRDALKTIEELKGVLAKLAPDDPRVRELIDQAKKETS